MMLHREGVRRAVERAFEGRQLVQCVGRGRAQEERLELRVPRGVVDFWPGDLVVRVGAGITLAELDAFLGEFGLEHGITAASPATHSLGGCFARAWQGVMGPELRECVLSALVVDGRGRPLELGARVVKNVAGYDLLRLHHGAGGALGALVEFVLRVRARPASQLVRQTAPPAGDNVNGLLELRAPGRDATRGEVFAGAGALRAWGLDLSRGRWLLFADGSEEETQQWERLVGGTDVALEAPRVGALGIDEAVSATTVDVFTATSQVLRVDPLWLDDTVRWWWLDARRGVLRVNVDEGQWTRLRSRVSGDAYVVRGGLDLPSTNVGHRVAEPDTETTLERLKNVWDPADIFPPLPIALR